MARNQNGRSQMLGVRARSDFELWLLGEERARDFQRQQEGILSVPQDEVCARDRRSLTSEGASAERCCMRTADVVGDSSTGKCVCINWSVVTCRKIFDIEMTAVENGGAYN